MSVDEHTLGHNNVVEYWLSRGECRQDESESRAKYYCPYAQPLGDLEDGRDADSRPTSLENWRKQPHNAVLFGRC